MGTQRSTFLLLFILTLPMSYQSWTQGCSDAGFCSFGSLKHQVADSLVGSKIQVLPPFGIGDEQVRVFAPPGLQFNYQFTDRWAAQAKITSNYASGNLGSVAGPGTICALGSRAR